MSDDRPVPGSAEWYEWQDELDRRSEARQAQVEYEDDCRAADEASFVEG